VFLLWWNMGYEYNDQKATVESYVTAEAEKSSANRHTRVKCKRFPIQNCKSRTHPTNGFFVGLKFLA
jgi:hypothetical protein